MCYAVIQQILYEYNWFYVYQLLWFSWIWQTVNLVQTEKTISNSMYSWLDDLWFIKYFLCKKNSIIHTMTKIQEFHSQTFSCPSQHKYQVKVIIIRTINLFSNNKDTTTCAKNPLWFYFTHIKFRCLQNSWSYFGYSLSNTLTYQYCERLNMYRVDFYGSVKSQFLYLKKEIFILHVTTIISNPKL